MDFGSRTAKFHTFSSEAKVAVVLFLVVGVLGVVYGIRGVTFRLNQPTMIGQSYQGPKFLSLSEQEAVEAAAQQARDTDADGLNDYDELYVYRTSPYLLDTDSDGVDDAQEIRLGKDPMCPEGQDCLRAYASVMEEGAVPIPAQLPEPVMPLDLSQFQNTDQVAARVKRASVDELRQTLLSTGVDPTIIAKLDETQVRDLFTQAIEEAKANGVLDELLAKLPQEGTVPAESSQPTTSTP